jgi:putative transposase
MPDEGMSRTARLALVDHADLALSVVAQCQLLKVARSTLHCQPALVNLDDLAVMRQMDALYLAYPFYGSRRMAAVLRREGWTVNRKRVRRLMRVMGLEAIYQKPNTSRRHPEHRVYPYLLRGLPIDRPNQVWCADITYIPMAKGFVYLVAVGAADAFRHIDPLRGPMDWFSRRVLAWRLSITLDTAFCVEALREAMDQHGQPEIFNTDQGVQFTSADFLGALEGRGVRISMDGRGRYLDNIFIERLWRSLKYEAVFIKAYGSVAETRRGISGWLTFYNDERPHQALSYRTPREVFEDAACEPVGNAAASLRCANALPTGSQAAQQKKDNNEVLTEVE